MIFSTPLTRKRRRPPNTDNVTALHEANFAKLAKVVPCLNEINGETRALHWKNSRLTVRCLEHSKYTRTFLLSLQHVNGHAWLGNIDIKIRNYYDARVT